MTTTREIHKDSMNKDVGSTNGLYLGGNSILHVQGFLQQEKVLIFISPSCSHNFINVDLDKRLKVPTNHIGRTQVDGEHVQVFKYLKITMDNYVLHSNFHSIDIPIVDIFLGYPWMKSVGTMNINVEK